MESKISDLEKTLETRTSDLEASRAELLVLKNTNTALKQEALNVEQRDTATIADLQAQIETLRAAPKPTRLPVPQQRSERAAAELAQVQEQLDRLQMTSARTESQLMKDIDQAKTEITRLEVACARADLATADAKAESMELKTEKAAIQQDLQANLRQSQFDLENARAEILRLQTQVATASTTVHVDVVSQLTSSAELARAEAAAERMRVGELEDQLRAASTTAEKSDELVKELQRTIADTRHELKIVKNDLAEAQSRNVQSDTALQESERKLASLVTKERETRDSFQRASRQIKGLEDELAENKAHLHSATLSRERETTKVAELTQQLSELKLTGSERQSLVMKLKTSESALKKARDKEVTTSIVLVLVVVPNSIQVLCNAGKVSEEG